MKLKGIGRVILSAMIVSIWANTNPASILTPAGMLLGTLLVVLMFSGVAQLSAPAPQTDPIHD